MPTTTEIAENIKSLKDEEKSQLLLEVISNSSVMWLKNFVKSFEDKFVYESISNAKTIFVNAVMGFTPHFSAGSAALDSTIDHNRTAIKMYGGGDTLQEFKNLCPGLYLSVLDNTQYYFFTGGGTVLTAIEQGSPYGLMPVKALMENK